jgi:hypothetical protein
MTKKEAEESSAKPFEKKFLNELENQISVCVEEIPHEERSNEFESVLITLKGPTSTSENLITRIEAENLLNSLSEFLSGDIEEEVLENDAASGTTQPTYIDESGKVFTASDIVGGYKPKGSYKGHSISDRVNSEDFGKTK